MKSKTILTVILTFGITLFMTNKSFAQSQNRQEKKPPTISELIKEMDANEDGKLSNEEVKGPLKKDFSKIDTNEDGFITEKELEKAPKLNKQRPQGR